MKKFGYCTVKGGFRGQKLAKSIVLQGYSKERGVGANYFFFVYGPKSKISKPM